MKAQIITTLSVLYLLLFSLSTHAQELYQLPKKKQTRWSSFENPTGAKGQGGKSNKGAKGHAFDQVAAGKSVTLMEVEGAGVINRIWLTINDRSPEMLRALRVDMYWDGEEKPAVSVPLGDFFGIGLGQRVPFESALFTDPEGRSFNCFVPMPFKEGAKITLTNESETDLTHLFYDVNFMQVNQHEHEVLYFHAYWNREMSTTLQEDFEILPKVEGSGRFLGTNVGVLTDSMYQNSWWGEGEVKMYIDGDKDLPTLIGTGTEDYVGTAWGQGTFDHMYQGSLIANDSLGAFAFYRYHIPDPVYFYKNLKVTIQQIGGWPTEKVQQLVENGAELVPITVDGAAFVRLFEQSPQPEITSPDFPGGWTNFYRSDDVSATAYFYLDKPVSNLPELVPVEQRVRDLVR